MVLLGDLKTNADSSAAYSQAVKKRLDIPPVDIGQLLDHDADRLNACSHAWSNTDFFDRFQAESHQPIQRLSHGIPGQALQPSDSSVLTGV